ncbi:MAG: hypothetical protein A2020_14555 [Lentisphaerae bacterium GWF2_45_14]|nr:MAG: hypothetical protein A2020_14555 [Lentisphaerae bacterium GWF2_45_14]
MPEAKEKVARKRKIRGQAVVEYSAMLAMTAAIMIMMIMLLAVFTEYGWRVLSLISDFPYAD